MRRGSVYDPPVASSELRDILLDATRAAFARKPEAVAEQLARWIELAASVPAAAGVARCVFCVRAGAAVWASTQADHSITVSREQGSASIGLCANCLAAAVAHRSNGVPPKHDIQRRVAAVLERHREPEAIAELDRVLGVAPALTSDVRDAVCSICTAPVSFKLVATARTRICDGCLKRLQAGA